MTRHPPIRLLYAGLTFACLMALVLSAFAHRAPSPLALGYDTVDVAQYVLPDGTLPVLCLPSSDGTHESAGKPCDFCAIAKSAFVAPKCMTAFSRVERSRFRQETRRSALVGSRLAVWPAPPTGPPALVG